MMTKEEVASIVKYCNDNGVSYKARFCYGSLNVVVGDTPALFATPAFLNKLAACYLTKYLCINELRKWVHAKSHEKTLDLAWHLVRCCAPNRLIISQ